MSWKTIGSTKKLKFQETIFKNHESERSNDTAPKTLPYRVRIKKCIWGSRTKLWIPKHWSISPRILYPYVDLDSIYSVGIGDTLNLQLKGFSIYGIEEHFLKKPNRNFEGVSGDSLFLVPNKDKGNYQVKLVDKKKMKVHMYLF